MATIANQFQKWLLDSYSISKDYTNGHILNESEFIGIVVVVAAAVAAT